MHGGHQMPRQKIHTETACLLTSSSNHAFIRKRALHRQRLRQRPAVCCVQQCVLATARPRAVSGACNENALKRLHASYAPA